MHLLMPFSSPIFTESTLLSEWMVDQRDEDRLRTNGFGCKRTWTANWQPRGIQVLRSQKKKKKNVFYFILQNVEGLWHSARESGREREKKNCWFDMEMKRWTRAWIAQVVNNLVVVNIKSIKLWMPGGWTWKERKKSESEKRKSSPRWRVYDIRLQATNEKRGRKSVGEQQQQRGERVQSSFLFNSWSSPLSGSDIYFLLVLSPSPSLMS